MISLRALFRTPAPAHQPSPADERRIARQVESERQRKAYADHRAAECRAARLRFTGEQA